jgi:hypothetical protein
LLIENAIQLRQRLQSVGLSDSAINAAWPTWWSTDADASVSAKAELRFSLSRKLGLDPHSLLEDAAEPRFVWRNAARFKHLQGETEFEQAGITSFGVAFGSVLLSGVASWRPLVGMTAQEMRATLMDGRPFVELADLLAIGWSLGIPIVHLRVFPWRRKRMAAMAVQLGARSAILLGRDAEYPAQIAFYVAHELGHVALGHVGTGQTIVDLEVPGFADPGSDPEENAADRYALALLTGQDSPVVLSRSGSGGARSLAKAALAASKELGIEPGTLALCFGYSTNQWPAANAALRHIYSAPKPVWREVNSVAREQLELDRIPDDAQDYVEAVLWPGTDAL